MRGGAAVGKMVRGRGCWCEDREGRAAGGRKGKVRGGATGGRR